jgi:branched-chain amino acid aminotransferase
LSVAWWNGRLVPAAEVRIDPGDAGFLHGDGLFETLRCDGGRARDGAAHLDRLLAGLARVEIAIPEERAALAEALAAVAGEAPRPVARLRLTVTRGVAGAGSADGSPTRLLVAAPYAPPDAETYRRGVAVHLLPDFRIDSCGPLAGLKSLAYQANRLALARAEERGAWEALLANEHGRLVEGSRTNVVLVLAAGAFTPPVADGCLPGTVRRRLLERGEIAERPLAAADLAAAREVILLNSLVGALPVARLDDRELAAGETAARWRALLP